jgi:hypothetical protein
MRDSAGWFEALSGAAAARRAFLGCGDQLLRKPF